MKAVLVGTSEVQSDVVQMDVASFADWDDAVDYASTFMERAVGDFRNMNPEDHDARRKFLHKNMEVKTGFRKTANDMLCHVDMTCRIEGLVAAAIVSECEVM